MTPILALAFPIKIQNATLKAGNRGSVIRATSLQVNLHREFLFRNSKRHYEGIPVIASNMDTVGTFEMAKALAEV